VLAFLDDDDLWTPDYLRSARHVLESRSVDAVVTAFERFSATGRGAVISPAPGLTAREVFRKGPGVTGSSIVLKRETFELLGGFDSELPVQNDRDLFLRLLSSGGSYAVQTAASVRIRDHSGGRLTDASAMRADGILLFLDKHGRAFTWLDRRILRYVSHRTRMSSTTSTRQFITSGVRAVCNWSPTGGQQIPLGLWRVPRRRPTVRDPTSGTPRG
jgi:hypothetical protein